MNQYMRALSVILDDVAFEVANSIVRRWRFDLIQKSKRVSHTRE